MEKLLPNLIIAFTYTLVLILSWVLLVSYPAVYLCPLDTLDLETIVLSTEPASVIIKMNNKHISFNFDSRIYLFNQNFQVLTMKNDNSTREMDYLLKNELLTFQIEAFTDASVTEVYFSLPHIKEVEIVGDLLNVSFYDAFDITTDPKDRNFAIVSFPFKDLVAATKVKTIVLEFINKNNVTAFEKAVEPLIEFYKDNNKTSKNINQFYLHAKRYLELFNYLSRWNNLNTKELYLNVINFIYIRKNYIEAFCHEHDESDGIGKMVKVLIDEEVKLFDKLNKSTEENINQVIESIRKDIKNNTEAWLIDPVFKPVYALLEESAKAQNLSGKMNMCMNKVTYSQFFFLQLGFVFKKQDLN